MSRPPGRSHVVARIEALDAAVHEQFKSPSAFARFVARKPDGPGRATVLNAWHRHVLSIEKAEIIADALGKDVGELFELSNGRRIQ